MIRTNWTTRWLAFAALLIARPALGHFVWIQVEPASEGSRLTAGFGEPGDWDEQFADRIKQTRYFVRDASGAETPVTLSFDKEEGCYVGTHPSKGPFAVVATCEYGLFQRGDAPAAMLRYYAKTLVGAPETWAKTAGSKQLAIEVTPSLQKDTIELLVTTAGGPLASGKISAFGPKSNASLEVKDGKATWPLEGPGVYSLFVGNRIPEKGEVDGKKFEAAAHYATLTFSVPGDAPATAAAGNGVVELPTLPLLPEAVSSFGAAVADGYLYVYSGHIGGAHRHSLANLSKSFRRVKLEPGAQWEELPMRTPLQGLPMVSYGGKVYRVGGLTAKNATTEQDADLHSQADFECFDPETGKWITLAPLPAPRSSHEAVVDGDKLYVVGGWNLAGGDETWHTHSLVYDLAAEHGEWKQLPEQPFERRALTAAVHNGKLYAIGGIGSDGEVVLRSDVLDLRTGKWSDGPALPEVPSAMQGGMSGAPGINGFGATAWNHHGNLYVGTFSGEIFRLSDKGDAWQKVTTLAIPRFFHRLLPLDENRLIAVGGASSIGHLRTIEVVDLKNLDRPTLSRWDVPAKIDSDHSQSVALRGGSLLFFGGNKSPAPHAFEPENFSSQSLAIDTATMQSETLPSLPEAWQSAAAITQRVDRQSRTILIGGMSNNGSGVSGRTQAAVLTTGKDQWSVVPDALPDPRAMFETVRFEKKTWIFGGMIPGSGSEPVLDVLCWDESSKGDVKFSATDVKLPRSRRSFAGAVHGERYFLVGGINSDGPVKEVDVWNFKTAQWETAAAPKTPRVFGQMAALNGKLYLVGGFSPSDSEHFAPNNTIEVFDPAKGEWSMHEAPLPEVGRGMRVFPANDRLMVCGVDPKEEKVQIAYLKP